MDSINARRSPTQPLKLPESALPTRGTAPLPAAPAPSPRTGTAPLPMLREPSVPFTADDMPVDDLGDVAAALEAFRQAPAADPQAAAWLSANGSRFTPEGRRSLERLAADGRLSAGLRAQLDQAVDPANPNGRVVAEALLAHLADPGSIAQGDRNTCVAASAQKALAQADPAAYFQLGWDVLADPDGAKLPDGRAQLSAENRAFIDGTFADLSPAATAAKLDAMIQSALTDYGNGAGDYDTRSDRTYGAAGAQAGLAVDQARRLNAALGIETLEPDHFAGQGDDAAFDEAIRAATSARAAHEPGPGLVVTASGAGDTALHMVMVKGVDAQGRLLVEDANGRAEAWSREQFAARLPREAAAGATIGDNTAPAAGATAPTNRPAPPPPTSQPPRRKT